MRGIPSSKNESFESISSLKDPVSWTWSPPWVFSFHLQTRLLKTFHSDSPGFYIHILGKTRRPSGECCRSSWVTFCTSLSGPVGMRVVTEFWRKERQTVSVAREQGQPWPPRHLVQARPSVSSDKQEISSSQEGKVCFSLQRHSTESGVGETQFHQSVHIWPIMSFRIPFIPNWWCNSNRKAMWIWDWMYVVFRPFRGIEFLLGFPKCQPLGEKG